MKNYHLQYNNDTYSAIEPLLPHHMDESRKGDFMNRVINAALEISGVSHYTGATIILAAHCDFFQVSFTARAAILRHLRLFK